MTSKLTFRPDIEGLRAIAVSLVVAAHAGVPWLPGGFIGVDIFFVLSGYLITGLLFNELNHTGHIDFIRFYARRFRRLAPGLLLMVLVTALLATQILSLTEQIQQVNAATSAVLWLSNFHYAFSGLDYFGPDHSNSLFLHTWSLGVEEQFYLLWPLLLILMLRFRRPAQYAGGSIDLSVPLAWVLAISLAAALLITPTAPMLAFYMMPMRAWQFALGALIWRFAATNGTLPAYVPGALGWLGLAAIAGSAAYYTPLMPYPGWRALIPSLGAAAVIAAGVSGAGPTRLLSLKPMLALGALSYSWYLWHWPVLVLGTALPVTDSAAYRLILVLLALALAALSFYCIERPIRRSDRCIPGVRTMLGSLAAAAAFCIIWGGTTLEQPFENNPANSYGADSYLLPTPYQQGCVAEHEDAEVKVCVFGNKQATRTVVLTGDSISAFWLPPLQDIFDGIDWRILVIAKKACPMVDTSYFLQEIRRKFTECNQWRDSAIKYIRQIEPDVLILASSAHYDFSEKQWLNGTKSILSQLHTATPRLFLMRSIPMLPFEPLNCLATRENWLYDLFPHSENRCTVLLAAVERKDIYQTLKQAVSAFDDVNIIEMNEAICPQGLCRAEKEGKLIFRDSRHLAVSFSRSLSGILRQKLEATDPLL